MKKARIIVAIILIIVLVAIVGGCVSNKNEVSKSPTINEQRNNEDSPEDEKVPDDADKATSDVAEKFEATPTPVKTAEVTTTPKVTEGIDDVVEPSKEPVAKVSEEPAPTKTGVKNTPTPVPTKVVAQNTPTPTKVEIVDVKINPVSKTVYVVVEAAKLVADPNKSSVGSNVLLTFMEFGDVSDWVYAPIKVSGITTDGMYYKGSYNSITGYILVGCVADALPSKQPSPTSTPIPIPTKGCNHSNTEAIEVYTTVPEEGHWETKEAWDEPVYVRCAVCDCGVREIDFAEDGRTTSEITADLFFEHIIIKPCSYGVTTVIVDYIHHPETHVWVIDKQEGTIYEYLGWSCIDCGYKHYDEDCMNGTCGIH